MKFTSTVLACAIVAAVATNSVSAQDTGGDVTLANNPCVYEIGQVCGVDMNGVKTMKDLKKWMVELNVVRACMDKAVADRTMCVNDWCSPCHEYITATHDDSKILSACASDARDSAHCSKYDDGQTVVNCLEYMRSSKKETLSDACNAELEDQDVLGKITKTIVQKARDLWAWANKGRTACKSDRTRLCADAAGDKRAVLSCMKAAAEAEPTTLSDDCFTYMSNRNRQNTEK